MSLVGSARGRLLHHVLWLFGQILGRLIPEWQQRVKKDLETYSMSVLQLHSRLQLRELEVWQQVADSYAQLLPPALAAVSQQLLNVSFRNVEVMWSS